MCRKSEQHTHLLLKDLILQLIKLETLFKHELKAVLALTHWASLLALQADELCYDIDNLRVKLGRTG